MPSQDLDQFYCYSSAAGQVKNYITNSLELTEKDRLSVATYIIEKRAQGIGGRRLHKIAFTLCTFRKYLEVEYPACTLLEYREAIANLFDLGSFKTNKPFSRHAIADYVVITKGFFSWMAENNMCTITLNDLRKVSVPKRNEHFLKPTDILSPEEILIFLDECKTSRDRALFSLMYEGGFRVGEVGMMKWGDLSFDNYGIRVTLSFKTGKPRMVRLLSCVKHVATWKSDTKGGTDDSDPVFIQINGGKKSHLTHAVVVQQMRRIATAAGIKKRIYPHLFRHSRITHLLADGIHESVIKLMMWGDVSSNQLKTYAHLSSTNIDNVLFERYNIKVQKDEKAVSYAPVSCPFCSQINPPNSGYCSTCGQKLDDNQLYSSDSFQSYINEHPELIMDYLSQKQERTPGR